MRRGLLILFAFTSGNSLAQSLAPRTPGVHGGLGASSFRGAARLRPGSLATRRGPPRAVPPEPAPPASR